MSTADPRAIIRQMAREAIGLRTLDGDQGEAFSLACRFIAYALGAVYHVGYDREAAERWRTAYRRIADIIRAAPLGARSMPIPESSIAATVEALMTDPVLSGQLTGEPAERPIP